MPFLGRTDYGGPFNAYFEALSNLGSEFVRYAPCTSPTRYPLIRTVLRRRLAQPVINPPPSLLLPPPPPGFPNPRVVVTELTPSDCTATKPATNWNSTLFDGIMADFMAAVCGPNAAAGEV
jgi:hypothetical protein